MWLSAVTRMLTNHFFAKSMLKGRSFVFLHILSYLQHFYVSTLTNHQKIKEKFATSSHFYCHTLEQQQIRYYFGNNPTSAVLVG